MSPDRGSPRRDVGDDSMRLDDVNGEWDEWCLHRTSKTCGFRSLTTRGEQGHHDEGVRANGRHVERAP